MSQPGPDSANDPVKGPATEPVTEPVTNAGEKQPHEPATARMGTGTAGDTSVTPKTPADTSGPVPGTTGAKTGSERGDETRADWKLFRAAVALVGLLLLGFGVFDVLTGTAGLPGPAPEVSPTLQSNYRFFAALMAGVGAAFLTIAVKFEWANVLWFVCAMVFIGGIARVISWALSGTPHVIMIVLMILELVIPPILVVWHRWIAKTAELKRAYSRDQRAAEGRR